MSALRPFRTNATEDVMDDSDHRSIGSRLDLFHQQEEGAGMVFWHPRGAVLVEIVEDELRPRMRRAGFSPGRLAQLLGRSLWEASGHWGKFRRSNVPPPRTANRPLPPETEKTCPGPNSEFFKSPAGPFWGRTRAAVG